MNRKHKSVVKKLRRQLDRMRVAFALADDHVQELQTLHDEDDMAIEHPKKVTFKPKGKGNGKKKQNYVRG